jgi:hypothetical protein
VICEYRSPKLGEALDDCEDILRTSIVDSEMRIALCDGATMSSFAKQWAELLADAYVLDPFCGSVDLKNRSVMLIDEWQRLVFSRPLSWHAQEKARSGAFATFLGLTVRNNEWSALAIGDTCLFHVRADGSLRAFPLGCSADFTNDPILLSSSHSANEEVFDQLVSCSGTLGPADLLLMATDGLASWLMTQHEAGRSPWSIFASDAGAVGRLCDERRMSREMKNDDVACAWIWG